MQIKMHINAFLYSDSGILLTVPRTSACDLFPANLLDLQIQLYR